MTDRCEWVSGCRVGLSRGQTDNKLFELEMEYVFRICGWSVKMVMIGRRLLSGVSPRRKSNGRITLKYMTAGRLSNWHVRDLQSLSSRAQYFRACHFDRADEVVRTARFDTTRTTVRLRRLLRLPAKDLCLWMPSRGVVKPCHPSAVWSE